MSLIVPPIFSGQMHVYMPLALFTIIMAVFVWKLYPYGGILRFLSSNFVLAFGASGIVFTLYKIYKYYKADPTPAAILLARVGSSTSGHALSYFALALLFLVAALVYKDGFKAFFMALGSASIHELLWFMFYFLHVGPAKSLIVAVNYSPFLLLCAAGLAGALLTRGDKGPLLAVFAAVLMYMMWWCSIGFPITLDNLTGPTIYYLSPFVNGVEDASWLLVGIVGSATMLYSRKVLGKDVYNFSH